MLKDVIQPLRIAELQVTLRYDVDKLLRDVATAPELNLWRPQLRVDQEVYETPLFKECMKPDDAANIAW